MVKNRKKSRKNGMRRKTRKTNIGLPDYMSEVTFVKTGASHPATGTDRVATLVDLTGAVAAGSVDGQFPAYEKYEITLGTTWSKSAASSQNNPAYIVDFVLVVAQNGATFTDADVGHDNLRVMLDSRCDKPFGIIPVGRLHSNQDYTNRILNGANWYTFGGSKNVKINLTQFANRLSKHFVENPHDLDTPVVKLVAISSVDAALDTFDLRGSTRIIANLRTRSGTMLALGR